MRERKASLIEKVAFKPLDRSFKARDHKEGRSIFQNYLILRN